MIKELSEQISLGNNLTIDQMSSVIDEILTGKQNDEQIAEFLKNLTTQICWEKIIVQKVPKSIQCLLEFFSVFCSV